VGDPWQGKGIGVTLMKSLLAIAKERGIETLRGVVLAENNHMLSLVRKIGGSISRGQYAGENEVKIDLSSVSLNL